MDVTDHYEKTEWTNTASVDTEFDESLAELFGDLLGTFADLLLQQMVETELDEQRKLIEEENYCAAILRQAAFVESLLQLGMIKEIESYREQELSNAEQEVVEKMGNKPTVYMASALGLLDDSEYEAYTKLMGTRNDVAHNWWLLFSDEEQEHFEHVTERVFETLESTFEDTDFS